MVAGQSGGSHRVVIVGGGFGGLYCAKSLEACACLADCSSIAATSTLFQPLLYQVATGAFRRGNRLAAPRGIGRIARTP